MERGGSRPLLAAPSIIARGEDRESEGEEKEEKEGERRGRGKVQPQIWLGAASTSALLGLPSSLGGVLPPPVASGVATIFRRRAATASNTVCSVAYSS